MKKSISLRVRIELYTENLSLIGKIVFRFTCNIVSVNSGKSSYERKSLFGESRKLYPMERVFCIHIIKITFFCLFSEHFLKKVTNLRRTDTQTSDGRTLFLSLKIYVFSLSFFPLFLSLSLLSCRLSSLLIYLFFHTQQVKAMCSVNSTQLLRVTQPDHNESG